MISEWIVNYLNDSVLGSPDDEESHFEPIIEYFPTKTTSFRKNRSLQIHP